MTPMERGSLLRRILLCHVRQTTLLSRRAAVSNAGSFLALFLLYVLLFVLWVATP